MGRKVTSWLTTDPPSGQSADFRMSMFVCFVSGRAALEAEIFSVVEFTFSGKSLSAISFVRQCKWSDVNVIKPGILANNWEKHTCLCLSVVWCWAGCGQWLYQNFLLKRASCRCRNWSKGSAVDCKPKNELKDAKIVWRAETSRFIPCWQEMLNDAALRFYSKKTVMSLHVSYW